MKERQWLEGASQGSDGGEVADDAVVVMKFWPVKAVTVWRAKPEDPRAGGCWVPAEGRKPERAVKGGSKY